MSTNATESLIVWGDERRVRLAPFVYLGPLCPEDKRAKYLDSNLDADKARNSLPARILVPENEVNPGHIGSPHPLLCPVNGDLLRCLNNRGGKVDTDQRQLVLRAYDRWLEFLIERRSLARSSTSGGAEPTGSKAPARLVLSLFFDDSNKGEKWRDWLQTRGMSPGQCHIPSWLTVKPLIQEEADRPDVSDLNFWRHKRLCNVESKLQERSGNSPITPVFFEEQSYRGAFFSFLYSLRPEDENQRFLAEYVLRQMVESALLRVLIVDDRIARTLWNRANRQERGNQLHYSRVWVAKRLWVSKHEIPLVDIKNDMGASPGFVEIKWDAKGNVLNSSESPHMGFDIIFLHQSIFDDRIWPRRGEDEGASKGLTKGDWVLNTKKTIPYVVFHSGRGKQREKLPPNVRFLEYSALQQHVLQEPSKVLLVLAGMSAAEA